jgi:hypothetical protein
MAGDHAAPPFPKSAERSGPAVLQAHSATAMKGSRPLVHLYGIRHSSTVSLHKGGCHCGRLGSDEGSCAAAGLHRIGTRLVSA